MSDRYDVAARLAEGRPAVEHTQTYVQACHALGYQQPDLTAHASQVRDWYDTEAGLDLRVLDADTAELRAAVNGDRGGAVGAAHAGHRARGGVARVGRRLRDAISPASLRRRGGRWPHMFALPPSTVRPCATTCGRQSTARSRPPSPSMSAGRRERSAWLAAAHTVTSGAGDRSAAEEVIHQQVMPYVDNDIRNDWLAAMGSSDGVRGGVLRRGHPRVGVDARSAFRDSGRLGSELAARHSRSIPCRSQRP